MATYQLPAYTPVQEPPPSQPSVAVQPGNYQPVPAQATAANVTVVQAPPTVQTLAYTESKPDNYLVFSVLTMLFCCFICGLIALIYSLKVDSAWNSGDLEGARCAAQTAKNWNIGALVSGIVTVVLVIIVAIVIPVVTVAIAAGAAGAAGAINGCYNSLGEYIC